MELFSRQSTSMLRNCRASRYPDPGGDGLCRGPCAQVRAGKTVIAAAACAAGRQNWMPASCPISLAGTASVRNSDWTIAPLPAELQDRRVELTGRRSARC